MRSQAHSVLQLPGGFLLTCGIRLHFSLPPLSFISSLMMEKVASSMGLGYRGKRGERTEEKRKGPSMDHILFTIYCCNKILP